MREILGCRSRCTRGFRGTVELLRIVLWLYLRDSQLATQPDANCGMDKTVIAMSDRGHSENVPGPKPSAATWPHTIATDWPTAIAIVQRQAPFGKL